MQTPERLKPGLYGAALGAVALAVAGFSWCGWVTGVAVLVVTPLASALAAPAEMRHAGTTRTAAVAAEDATGSVAKSAEEEPGCQKSRRKLWVEGEGWIIRRVTTGY
jgi:membrane protein implicated in regulation of membrane protease activity